VDVDFQKKYELNIDEFSGALSSGRLMRILDNYFTMNICDKFFERGIDVLPGSCPGSQGGRLPAGCLA
jgi:hypothetical protein